MNGVVTFRSADTLASCLYFATAASKYDCMLYSITRTGFPVQGEVFVGSAWLQPKNIPIGCGSSVSIPERINFHP